MQAEGGRNARATNRPDLVEPSLLRPGRLGATVDVPLPNPEERRGIAHVLLRSVPGRFDRRAAAALIARAMDGRSGTQIRALVDRIKLETVAAAVTGKGVRVTDRSVRRAVDAFSAGVRTAGHQDRERGRGRRRTGGRSSRRR